MYQNKRKAFTMIELIFIIVIIGILSAVAIPKFAMNRDNAIMAKAKNTVASVRSALATERQKHILQGEFGAIDQLSSVTLAGENKYIFDGFDGNVSNPVLSYSLSVCKVAADTACWYMPDEDTYRFNLPLTGNVDFIITGSKFVCKDSTEQGCKDLTQ